MRREHIPQDIVLYLYGSVCAIPLDPNRAQSPPSQ